MFSERWRGTKLWNKVTPYVTATKKMVLRSVLQRTRRKVAFNLFISHRQVTKTHTQKKHWTQMFVDNLLTIFIHTTCRKSLQLVQNIYSKWLMYPFQYFSNSAERILALLVIPCLMTLTLFQGHRYVAIINCKMILLDSCPL